MSGGQKQRLALARALAPGNSIVLLDEPFNSLDLQVRIRLRNELSSVLKSCSASAIFVTHDSQEALAICDRVAVMKNGELYQFDSPTQIVNNPVNSFVGEFMFTKNTLPIKLVNNKLISPIGIVNYFMHSPATKCDLVMFDPKDISISFNKINNAVIKSREFFYEYWIITVQVSEYLLRVWHPIDSTFEIGQECSVSFKSNIKIKLFPGPINVNVE